jgi:LysM repeat protein
MQIQNGESRTYVPDSTLRRWFLNGLFLMVFSATAVNVAPILFKQIMNLGEQTEETTSTTGSRENPWFHAETTPHTVQAGETLAGIAAHYWVTAADLLAKNTDITDPNNIQTGDIIDIPAWSYDLGRVSLVGLTVGNIVSLETLSDPAKPISEIQTVVIKSHRTDANGKFVFYGVQVLENNTLNPENGDIYSPGQVKDVLGKASN